MSRSVSRSAPFRRGPASEAPLTATRGAHLLALDVAQESDGFSTKPSDDPPAPGKRKRQLGIRWVFPDFSGAVRTVSARPVVFGRGEESDVVLLGSEISRRHAELRWDGDVLSIKDLGSRNGLFVGGVQLVESPLQEGDVVRLGEWVGVVVHVDEREPNPAFAEIAPGLLGGPALARAVELGLRAANSTLPIVLEGETGTGKEVTARAIHALSGRTGPFVGVNCAAIPEALAEGELFGYRRGAFTGAAAAHAGHFRSAQGGTLLLDELTELPLPVQAKLLRVLEERRVVPLGELASVPLDVRVIAATQQPLAEAVLEKRFRADLFARLDGLTVKLPPLRQRPEDLGYLVHELLARHAEGKHPALEALLVEALCLHSWPFNVRELDLLVRRLLVLFGNEPLLGVRHLPESWRNPSEMPAGGPPPASESREDYDLARLVAQLKRHKGNLARAASEVGISRQRAYRLIGGRPDLDLHSFRGEAANNTDKE